MSFAPIAGHVFQYDVRGKRICKGCGTLWVHVAVVTRDDIGRRGFSHHGELTETGYYEITQERDRIYEQVTLVAASPGYASPDSEKV